MYRNGLILPFLILFTFSCTETEKTNENKTISNTPEETVQPELSDTTEETLLTYEEPLVAPDEDWDAHQDSIRALVWEQKPNKALKSGFLQEFYLRGVVQESGENLDFDIRFDVHGMDCGAPDCYETRLRFSFPFDGELNFPETVAFSEEETGCIDHPYYIENEFELVNASAEYVLYNCASKKRSLLLYGLESEYKDALYFINYNVDEINIDRPFEKEEEGDDKFIYSSWILVTNDYEFFLD